MPVRATPTKSTKAPKYQGTIVIAPPTKLRFGRRAMHARYEPLDVPYQSPWGRDDEDEADQEHEAAPDEVPNSEIDRKRAVAVPADARQGAARTRNHRRTGAAGRQARNFCRLLPIRHPLGPDQRVRGDGASGDQLAELDFGIWPLLLALGCIKPGSSRHIIPSPCSDAPVGPDAGKCIVADDPIRCTGTPAGNHKVFPRPLQLFCASCTERCQIWPAANRSAAWLPKLRD